MSVGAFFERQQISFMTSKKGGNIMYISSFKKFFVAFIFIMVEFRVKGFDVLPDFIGYILILNGLSAFQGINDLFERARKLVFPMLLLSALTFYQTPGSNLTFDFSIIVGMLGEIIKLFLIYYLFVGIKNMADDRRLDKVALEAESSWRFYLIIGVANLIAFALVFSPVIFIQYKLAMFFFNIFVMLKILKFMNISKDTIY